MLIVFVLVLVFDAGLGEVFDVAVLRMTSEGRMQSLNSLLSQVN